MVLGLAGLDRKHLAHVDFQLVTSGRLDSYGGTCVYNGRKHHKWYTYG